MSSKYNVLSVGDADADESESYLGTARRRDWFSMHRFGQAPLLSGTTSQSWTATLRNLILYTFATWGLFSSIFQLLPSASFRISQMSVTRLGTHGCRCGNSVSEAIDLGCKFDALSMAWLPEHCRDDELTEEFDTMGKGPNGTWIYYADTEHTIEVDVAEVAAMGNDPSQRVHMDKDWHQVHCIYYWLKLHRTRFNGKIVEPRSNTEDHIRHCGMVLREPGYGTISGVALDTDEAVPE